MSQKKILLICGPTATGKTTLAIELAQKFKGEIVSADSRQIYRGMDVGTGKDIPINSRFQALNAKQFQVSKTKFQIGYYEINDIRVWLYDVVEPDYQFSVADYLKCASLVVKDIWKRGKMPLLVGGTGFYLKAVVDGIKTIGIRPNRHLRKSLDKYNVAELQEFLEIAYPGRSQKMNESDRSNPRRLIRAIEVALVASDSKAVSTYQYVETKEVLFIGLKAPFEELYERVDNRVEARVEQGVEKEIDRLLEQGCFFENSALGRTIGYFEWENYFKQGGSNLELKKEAIQRWKFDEHRYARRQVTWFKKDKRITWFDISEPNYQDQVATFVSKWYYKN